MFDIFDIQIPALSPSAPVEVRQQETAFGLADGRTAYVDGVEFGRVLLAEEAYSNLHAWMASADRGAWTVLSVAPAASEAADDDRRWPQFLAAVVSVLQAHGAWVVRCESDCDQRPVERFEISAERVAALLDSLRTERAKVAFVATSP
jgi:hypothetical protein